MLPYILTTLSIINLVAFTLMGVDKWLATSGKRRIPETTLLLPGVLGGVIGMIAGMLSFSHKTRKTSFKLAVAGVAVVNAVVAYLWLHGVK
ncbi:MAG: DUF1294 domain-containing protein [Planctomycetota bacterium]